MQKLCIIRLIAMYFFEFITFRDILYPSFVVKASTAAYFSIEFRSFIISCFYGIKEILVIK